MNSWLLPCLLSTLASSALAQKTTNVAWDAFVREHGTEWAVEWSPATGTPTAIYGQGLSLPGRTANLADARRRSEQTLERYAALLGRGASKFVEITGEPAMRLYVFVYKQEFKGLQVIDGRADVRVHANGGISMFGAEAIPVPADFNVVPTLTLAKAHKAAGRHLSLANLHAPNEPKAADRLVVWSDVGQRVPVAPRLAWDIDVGVPSVNKVGRAYIDAHTGALLEYRNEILNCCKRLREAVLTPTTQPEAAESGEFYVKVIPDPSAPTNGATVDGTISAWSINDLDPYAGLTLMPMPHFKIGTTFTDASGKFSLPGNSVTVTLRFAGKHIGKVTASSGVTFSKTLTLSGSNNKIVIYTQAAPEYDRSQSTAFLYVTRCNLFMRNYMTSKSGLDKLNTFTADVNVGGSCNAFYQNNNARFYRKSGTCPNMAYSSIVQHEWGHGLDDSYGGLQYGECQEGMADACAIMQNDDPVVGLKFFSPTRNLRTALNTRTYPAGGGVHQQGETWMGWMWDCRVNFVATHGKAKAVTLMRTLFSNVFITSPGTQPTAVREVFILDDDDNILNNGTPNYNDLEQACLKRKLPYPKKKLCPHDASFSTYGTGCQTAPQACTVAYSQNLTQTLANTTTTANKVAIMEVNRPRVNICQVDLYTRARSGSVTVNVTIADYDTKGLPNKVLASGSVTVGSTAAVYSAKMTKPVVIDENNIHFIVFDNADKLVLPETSSGNKSFYYLFQNNKWSNIGYGRTFKYRVHGDLGTQIPALSNTGRPIVGGLPFSVDLSHAPQKRLAVLFVGGSKTNWNTLNLPLDLTPFGAPGCSLLAGGDAMLGTVTNAQGNGSRQFPIPLSMSLCTLKVYFQYLVIDQKANTLGLALSNAGEALLGSK